MRHILIALIVALSPCCKKSVKSTLHFGKSTVGVVSPSVITEEILDQDFGVGVSQTDVELRLGKAYEYNTSNNTVSATYYIQKELTKTSELISFTFYYRDGKITHVDKTWL